MYASTLDDSKSQARYDQNVVRLENILQNKDENRTTVKNVLTSTSALASNEKSENNNDKKQSWSSWFSNKSK